MKRERQTGIERQFSRERESAPGIW